MELQQAGQQAKVYASYREERVIFGSGLYCAPSVVEKTIIDDKIKSCCESASHENPFSPNLAVCGQGDTALFQRARMMAYADGMTSGGNEA